MGKEGGDKKDNGKDYKKDDKKGDDKKGEKDAGYGFLKKYPLDGGRRKLKLDKKNCGAPSYVGDGNCDDNNNHATCLFDGGDCCAKSVKGGQVSKKYCSQCKCADPAYQVGKDGGKKQQKDGD